MDAEAELLAINQRLIDLEKTIDKDVHKILQEVQELNDLVTASFLEIEQRLRDLANQLTSENENDWSNS